MYREVSYNYYDLQYSSLRGTNPDRLRLGNKRGTEFSYLGPFNGQGKVQNPSNSPTNRMKSQFLYQLTLLFCPSFESQETVSFLPPLQLGVFLVFIKVSSYRLQIAGQSQLSGHFDADQSESVVLHSFFGYFLCQNIFFSVWPNLTGRFKSKQ